MAPGNTTSQVEVIARVLAALGERPRLPLLGGRAAGRNGGVVRPPGPPARGGLTPQDPLATRPLSLCSL